MIEKPPLPPKPELPEESGRGKWFPIAVAAAVAALILTVLSYLTMHFIGPVIPVAMSIFAIAALHYLVWGWWLEPRLRKAYLEQDRDDDK